MRKWVPACFTWNMLRVAAARALATAGFGGARHACAHRIALRRPVDVAGALGTRCSRKATVARRPRAGGRKRRIERAAEECGSGCRRVFTWNMLGRDGHGGGQAGLGTRARTGTSHRAAWPASRAALRGASLPVPLGVGAAVICLPEGSRGGGESVGGRLGAAECGSGCRRVSRGTC